MKPQPVSLPAISILNPPSSILAGRGFDSHRFPALRQVTLIATKELGDRLRSGWVLACLLVWLGAVGLTSVLGLVQIGRLGVQGYERTVMSLLNLVQYLVPLLGLLLGHDLIISEKEEHTLRPILASGVSRTRVLLGKFLGGCSSLGAPLLLGFGLAGGIIGIATRDTSIAPFIRLATSGLVLGLVFLAIGLAISTWSRSRVQALVLALLTWCLAVFVFDLVALGCLITTQSPVAAHEIELVCDATHVNAAADVHSAFDASVGQTPQPAQVQPAASLGLLAVNPVDLFRAANLSQPLGINVPPLTTAVALTFWFTSTLGASLWKLRRTDL